MSTENFICRNCGLRVPEKQPGRHNDGTKNIELWSGGVNGENARHVWEAGCMAARKRNANVQEPDVVY